MTIIGFSLHEEVLAIKSFTISVTKLHHQNDISNSRSPSFSQIPRAAHQGSLRQYEWSQYSMYILVTSVQYSFSIFFCTKNIRMQYHGNLHDFNVAH